jgi:predicted ATP-dependent serine protease
MNSPTVLEWKCSRCGVNNAKRNLICSRCSKVVSFHERDRMKTNEEKGGAAKP